MSNQEEKKSKTSEWILDYLNENNEIENCKLRFQSKFIKSKGCWNWIAPLQGRGYGAFKPHETVVGRKTVPLILAHRMAYIFEYGQFDSSFKVCHRCDNPKCVNPEHLFLGTQSQNLSDASKKKRLRGQKNHSPLPVKMRENLKYERVKL